MEIPTSVLSAGDCDPLFASPPSRAPLGERAVEFRVPPGAVPGGFLTVPLKDGELLKVCMPEMAREGDMLRLQQRTDGSWRVARPAADFSFLLPACAAGELLRLPAPAQRTLWQERVHCGPGRCAGEAAARLLAALAAGGQLPLRGFEPWPDDPLYELWKAADRQDFQSWADGQDAPGDAPLAALVPEGQSLAVGRFQAAEFMRQARARMVEFVGGDFENAFGRCLEWDEPFYAVKAFGGLCRRYDVLTYANPSAGQDPRRRVYRHGTRIISADIMNPPSWFPRDYGLVICLFVLEHVPDPFAALRGVVRALLPGGFLLVGAPFIDGVHACPDDFLRYTPRGLRHAVEAAGLEVLWSFSPGNPAVAAGDLLGMKSSYWSLEEIMDESDTHPVNVFLLARKPGSHRLGPPRPNRSAAA